jgi:hypothetical protein
MNYPVFFIALGIGICIALVVSWRYSRKGIHPRFYPHFGLVVMVFVTLSGAAAFVAFLLSRMVGNPTPQINNPSIPVVEKTEPIMGVQFPPQKTPRIDLATTASCRTISTSYWKCRHIT